MFPASDTDAYRRWRDQKLENLPRSLDELTVEIRDLGNLSENEIAALNAALKRANMAIYSSPTFTAQSDDKALIRSLGARFGLQRLDHNMGADEDAITSLSVQPDALHRHYIPYTDRPIAWHTDGYYNDRDHQIHALLLHCVHPADEGGANQLLDHEMAYIQLYEQSPDYIQALMHPQAMTIPANKVDGQVIRPERTGPVFRITESGRLHMRYTDRKRSIRWRQEDLTQAAVQALKDILHSASPYIFKGRLQPGQGLISRNVLHTRTAFKDGNPGRLIYRARYIDEIH
ncbi:MAG: TauD/TfdA family dioxygenase [Gammaproteobacteria bacterium]